MKHVSTPTPPWEGALTRKPEIPPHMYKLISHVFTGNVSQQDLTYMAKAILQMSDENYELRERVCALELAFAAVRGGNAK